MSSTPDPLDMTYWHLHEDVGVMDWNEILAQTKDFTDDFAKTLTGGLTEEANVRRYFWDRIRHIVQELGATLVTAETDALLIISKTDFTFVYCSLMKHALHTGFWMAVPHNTSANPLPKIMCCFLHQAKIQKGSEWTIPDSGTLKTLVDSTKSINLT